MGFKANDKHVILLPGYSYIIHRSEISFEPTVLTFNGPHYVKTLTFNSQKILYPFKSELNRKESHATLNLQLIKLPNKYYLYLEEAALLRDKDNSTDPDKHPDPMIFSYQKSQYENQYENYIGNYENDTDNKVCNAYGYVGYMQRQPFFSHGRNYGGLGYSFYGIVMPVYFNYKP